MRVLHVLGELRHSGAEMMLAAAGPSFAARGVESEIMSTGADVGSLAPGLASAGYGIHHAPFAKRPAYFLRVYRAMRAGRYDVIHLHTERANFWFGIVAVAARPARVVRTIHNVFSFEGRLRRRRGSQRRILHRLGVIHVACSESIQRNELARFGLEARLVPNWYDSRRFFIRNAEQRVRARGALGLADDDVVLVSVGNCSDVKNHSALITAISQGAGSNRLAYLHVGAEEPGDPERVLATELGVAERVRFLGPVDDVSSVFAASDLFAMPSKYEGFPIAVLEALACGVPALLSDVPGLRDFRELYPGLAYADPTPESIAAALDRLLRVPADEIRAAAEGYADITLRRFGLETGVERYLRLYEGAA